MNRRNIFTIALMLFTVFITFLFVYNKNTINREEFKNPINVLFITDNNYVMPVSAAIRSIIANKNKDTQIEISIIGVDLFERNITKLEKYNKKNIKINVINISNSYLQNLSGGEDCENKLVSRADNAKLFLNSILKDKDKIIYFDGDIIVLKDLSDFYNIELGENYIAAADDWQTGWEDRENERYFNNGVMLLNLKEMRKNNVDKKLFEAKNNDTRKRFVTQDAYNTVMLHKVHFIPLIYDTFAPEFDNNYIPERIREVLGKNLDLQMYPYNNSDEFRKNVVAIHYCGWGNLKPWKNFDLSLKSSRIWYKYAPLDFWIGLAQGRYRLFNER